jgi:hypothetical protein
LCIPFDHSDIYLLGCFVNADFSLLIFIPLTHSLYLSLVPVLSNRKLQKPVMTTSHLMAGTGATPTVSAISNLLQTKSKRQHVSIFCQTLSQTFRESLIITLQILNMTTTRYYTDTNCTEDRKQINDKTSGFIDPGNPMM